MERINKIEFTPEEKTVVTKFTDLLGELCNKIECHECPFYNLCPSWKNILDFIAVNGGVYLEK